MGNSIKDLMDTYNRVTKEIEDKRRKIPSKDLDVNKLDSDTKKTLVNELSKVGLDLQTAADFVFDELEDFGEEDENSSDNTLTEMYRFYVYYASL